MATKIAILNFKGGVGKTTTAINLGAALGLADKRVLIVDTDFQCNSTRTFGFKEGEGITIYDILTGKVKEMPVYSFKENVDYIPSSKQMEFITETLSGKMRREYFLQKILNVCKGEYDFIIIDCPSNGGLMNTNAMCASDYIIVPMECEMYSLQGIATLTKQIKDVQEEANEKLKLMGYLRTRYRAQLGMHRSVSEELERRYPDMTIPVIIRSNTDLTKVSSEMPTIYDYNEKAIGAEDYRKLAEWVIERCQP